MPKASGSADNRFTINVSFSPASSTAPSSLNPSHSFPETIPASLHPGPMMRESQASRVPEVGGGARILIGALGKEASISLQFLGLGPFSAIAIHNWPGEKFSFFDLALLAKAIPSLPTMISIISVTPFFAHNSFSLPLIAREALVKSGWLGPKPPQKSFMPPPVPVDSITGVFMEPRWPCFSATTVAKG